MLPTCIKKSLHFNSFNFHDILFWIYCVWFLEILQFHLSACNFSPNLWTFFHLFNAANLCKELTIFQFNWYPLLGNFSILSICAQLCSHTVCTLLVILQGALWKQSFFYEIFNSQNNIVSMRRYPELLSKSDIWRKSLSADCKDLCCACFPKYFIRSTLFKAQHDLKP